MHIPCLATYSDLLSLHETTSLKFWGTQFSSGHSQNFTFIIPCEEGNISINVSTLELEKQRPRESFYRVHCSSYKLRVPLFKLVKILLRLYRGQFYLILSQVNLRKKVISKTVSYNAIEKSLPAGYKTLKINEIITC